MHTPHFLWGFYSAPVAPEAPSGDAAGAAGGPCNGNGTCDTDLVCVDGTCQTPADGTSGGACYGNGTCNADLVCVDDVCRVTDGAISVTFTADDGQIELGASTTLRWTVSGADGCTLDNGIGPVEPTGDAVVTPTYRLTCTRGEQEGAAAVTVTVDDPNARALTGTVELGTPVEGAEVVVYAYDIASDVQGAALARAHTDANGQFVLPIAADVNGAVWLDVRGGAYVERASGASSTLDTALLAVLHVTDGRAPPVAVNGLTTLSVMRAERDGSFDATNTALAAYVNDTFFALAETPSAALDGQAPLASPRTRVALWHAGLSRLAAEWAAPGAVGASTLLSRLKLDIADGVLDGAAAGARMEIAGRRLDAHTMRQALSAAIELYIRAVPFADTQAAAPNTSGLTLDALNVNDGFLDRLATSTQPHVFPAAASARETDGPLLSHSFASHPRQPSGAGLSGEVALRFTATDATRVARIDVVHPAGVAVEHNAAADVVWRVDNTVLPNAEAVHLACGAGDIPGNPADHVCACAEATDVLGNTARHLACFSRPEPAIEWTKSYTPDHELRDNVTLRARVHGGYALSSITVGGGDLSYTELPSGELEIVVPTTFTRGIGRTSTVDLVVEDIRGQTASSFTSFKRGSLDMFVAQPRENRVFGPGAFPIEIQGGAFTAYRAASCAGTVVNDLGEIVFGPSTNPYLQDDACEFLEDVPLLPDGAYDMITEATDVKGEHKTVHRSFIVESGPAVRLSTPAIGAATNAASLTIEGTVTAAATAVTVTLTGPGGQALPLAATLSPVPGSTHTAFSLDSPPLDAQGDWLVHVEATTAGGTLESTRKFLVDRQAPSFSYTNQYRSMQMRDTTRFRQVGSVDDGTAAILPDGYMFFPEWDDHHQFYTWTSNLNHEMPGTGHRMMHSGLGDNDEIASVHHIIDATCRSDVDDTWHEGGDVVISNLDASGQRKWPVDFAATLGGHAYCISVVAVDRAGNRRAGGFRFWLQVSHPPAVVDQSSAMYDPASTPFDLAGLSPAHIAALVNGTTLSHCADGPCGAPNGAAFASTVVHNPWAVPLTVSVDGTWTTPPDMRFSAQEVLVHQRAAHTLFPQTVEFGGDTWMPAIRNPLHTFDMPEDSAPGSGDATTFADNATDAPAAHWTQPGWRAPDGPVCGADNADFHAYGVFVGDTEAAGDGWAADGMCVTRDERPAYRVFEGRPEPHRGEQVFAVVDGLRTEDASAGQHRTLNMASRTPVLVALDTSDACIDGACGATGAACASDGACTRLATDEAGHYVVSHGAHTLPAGASAVALWLAQPSTPFTAASGAFEASAAADKADACGAAFATGWRDPRAGETGTVGPAGDLRGFCGVGHAVAAPRAYGRCGRVRRDSQRAGASARCTMVWHGSRGFWCHRRDRGRDLCPHGVLLAGLGRGRGVRG